MPLKRKKAVSKKKMPAKKPVKRKVVARKKPSKAGKPKPSIRKKPAKRSPAKSGPSAKVSSLKEGVIGSITHYFPHVRAGVIKLKAPLSAGETVRIKGYTTDFTQKISSMQIDRKPIERAKKGDEIGILVNSRVRRRDLVYKV